MSWAPRKLLAAGLFGSAVLIVAAAEGLARWHDPAVRVGIYIGGAAGILVVSAGLPFMQKLAHVAETRDLSARFWRWWGLGVFCRLVLLGILALGMIAILPWHATAALLAMMAVYFAGMLGEALWLADLFVKSDESKGAKQ